VHRFGGEAAQALRQVERRLGRPMQGRREVHPLELGDSGV
jgi:hypothetical protein